MICAGIDYSTTSPCICVFKKDGTINPIDCNFSFFALDKWRPRWSALQNVNVYKFPKDLKSIDRYQFLAEKKLGLILARCRFFLSGFMGGGRNFIYH